MKIKNGGGNSGGNTVENLELSIELIELIFHNEKWETLKELLDKDLIIPEQLAAVATAQGNAQRINTILGLVTLEQWELLKNFLDKGLITSEQLAATPAQGNFQGANAILGLIIFEQWELLKNFLDKGLITSEQLAATPAEGRAQGVNAILGLITFEQWELLKNFLDKGLITSEQLAVTPAKGRLQGVNAILGLIIFEQWELLSSLIHKKLIKANHLYNSSLDDINQPSVLNEIIKNNHWKLLSSLLMEINQIEKPPTLKYLLSTIFKILDAQKDSIKVNEDLREIYTTLALLCCFHNFSFTDNNKDTNTILANEHEWFKNIARLLLKHSAIQPITQHNIHIPLEIIIKIMSYIYPALSENFLENVFNKEASIISKAQIDTFSSNIVGEWLQEHQRHSPAFFVNTSMQDKIKDNLSHAILVFIEEKKIVLSTSETQKITLTIKKLEKLEGISPDEFKNILSQAIDISNTVDLPSSMQLIAT